MSHNAIFSQAFGVSQLLYTTLNPRVVSFIMDKRQVSWRNISIVGLTLFLLYISVSGIVLLLFI